MLTFQIEIFGEKVLSRALAGIAQDAVNYTRVGPKIQEIFLKSNEETFNSIGHGRWKPLSKNYARWKAKHFPNKPLMRRTDELFKSLTQKGAKGTVYEAKKDELTLGTKVKRGRWHHRGEGVLPERRLIDLSEKAKREITRAIQRDAMTKAKEEGFEVK